MVSTPPVNCPELAWPESFGPDDGEEIAAAIVDVFRSHGHVNLESSAGQLILVPDPPQSGESQDWIESHFTVTANPDLVRFDWGTRGVGYVSQSQQCFARLLAVFLAMGSTTLLVMFAPRGSGTGLSLDEVVERVVANYAGRPVPGVAALYFDFGELRSVTALEG